MAFDVFMTCFFCYSMAPDLTDDEFFLVNASAYFFVCSHPDFHSGWLQMLRHNFSALLIFTFASGAILLAKRVQATLRSAWIFLLTLRLETCCFFLLTQGCCFRLWSDPMEYLIPFGPEKKWFLPCDIEKYVFFSVRAQKDYFVWVWPEEFVLFSLGASKMNLAW